MNTACYADESSALSSEFTRMNEQTCQKLWKDILSKISSTIQPLARTTITIFPRAANLTGPLAYIIQPCFTYFYDYYSACSREAVQRDFFSLPFFVAFFAVSYIMPASVWRWELAFVGGTIQLFHGSLDVGAKYNELICPKDNSTLCEHKTNLFPISLCSERCNYDLIYR